LNGVGSVGKSSIAKELQAIAMSPFLHVEMDAFIAMLPARTYGHPDGLTFEKITTDAGPEVAIRSGEASERCLRGMRRAVAAMATEGNDLVVDDVLMGEAGAEYRALLAAHELRVVGVFAPIDVLEERERRRGDRMIGLARWQFDRVHAGMTYDLEIDTANATPMECARHIRDRFGL
jgi:chloramphenicol 3-O phosphotransferase